MTWPLAALIAYLLLALDLGLSPALSLFGGVTPSFLLPLVVFIAMNAPFNHALWFALASGAALDLLAPAASPDGGVAIHLGPNAAGYMLAAYLVLQLRAMVIKRNPRSLVALTILAGVAAAIASTFLVSIRSIYDGDGGSLTTMLFRQLASAVYSGAPALLLALPLNRFGTLFGFPDPNSRRFARRQT